MKNILKNKKTNTNEIELFLDKCGKLKKMFLQNVSLKKYCTMGTGGNATLVCFPEKVKQLKKIIELLNSCKIKFVVVGNGSNIIFKDSGFGGCVICTKKMTYCKIKSKTCFALCGCNLNNLILKLQKKQRGGFCELFGIPATVGGAIVSNAGANNVMTSDFIKSIGVLEKGRIKKYSIKKLKFGYRKSQIKEKDLIVLFAVFNIKKINMGKEQEKMQNYYFKRKSSQPLGTKNSGCIFKKTNEIIAGKIIDKIGLKNAIINNAQISNIHANFIVNLGDAKSEDIENLILLIQTKVQQQTGVLLEKEVEFIGD